MNALFHKYVPKYCTMMLHKRSSRWLIYQGTWQPGFGRKVLWVPLSVPGIIVIPWNQKTNTVGYLTVQFSNVCELDISYHILFFVCMYIRNVCYISSAKGGFVHLFILGKCLIYRIFMNPRFPFRITTANAFLL